jgi:SAM-dependent methyltransferase
MSQPILTQLQALKREDFRDLPPLAASDLNESSSQEKAPRVSLLIPAREANEMIEVTLRKSHEFLSKRFPGSFEIILIPNPAPGTAELELKAQLKHAEEVVARYPGVRTVPHLSPPGIPGKGAALRTAFLASKGEIVCFTDADLPYDLSFFDQAFARLDLGYDLITANRRHGESRFDIPISLLPLAYGRHRLGLLFNRVVRWFFPVQTTDTQAGIKALSRRLAEKAFRLQRCPGFFFDLEMILVNRAQGWAQAEIPVSLKLNSEKSTVRIIREAILALYWLGRIWQGHLTGHYGKKPHSPKILTRYHRLPLGTRLFLFLRWWLTPYSQMAAHLPRSGRIVDYGCGHGLFGLALAQESQDRDVTGVDHDVPRIQAACEASQGLRNLRFTQGELFAGPPAKGIALIDVMHYFDPETQARYLKSAYEQLEPNGVLIFREVDPHGGIISGWNRLYEKLATSVGFTRSNEQKLYFRPREEWLELLRSIGFKAKAERCSSVLFADVLFIGEKSALPTERCAERTPISHSVFPAAREEGVLT